MAMNRKDLEELLLFAEEQGLMEERFDLVYAKFLILRRSWLAGLIQGV